MKLTLAQKNTIKQAVCEQHSQGRRNRHKLAGKSEAAYIALIFQTVTVTDHRKHIYNLQLELWCIREGLHRDDVINYVIRVIDDPSYRSCAVVPSKSVTTYPANYN